MFELRKIGIVKRASALLLDAILLAVLTTGFMFVISLICNYRGEEQLATQYFDEWEDFRITYVEDVANYYGYVYESDGATYTITKDGQPTTLNNLIEELVASEGKDAAIAVAYEKYQNLPSVEKVNAQYQYVYTLLFMMVSVGLLLAYLILEFLLPLIFKNGQTIGKKIFGVGLVRLDCVKISNLALFARTIVGKFAIETMFPTLLVFLFFFGGMGVLAIILFAAITLLNVVLFFATRNKTPIHDILSGTVAIDIKLQMIFESAEELAEKKALLQKEIVKNTQDQ